MDENVQSVTLHKICHLRFDAFSVTVLPVTGNTNHPVPSVVWDGGIHIGLDLASDILERCGEEKAKEIVDAIANALPGWMSV